MLDLFVYADYNSCNNYFLVHDEDVSGDYSNIIDLIKDLSKEYSEMFVLQAPVKRYNNDACFKLIDSYTDAKELIEDFYTNKVEELL